MTSAFDGVPHKHFKVVVADPPWQFHAWSHRGEGKGASQHYDVMNLDDICALPVADLVTDDAALFLWVVQPQLPEALKVIEAWGFHYRTVAFVWIKMKKTWSPSMLAAHHLPRLGLGYHTRSGTEQCWLAIRGKGYTKKSQSVAQVIMSPLREHSRKPDEMYKSVEALVGDVPRIELFARGPRDGWTVWGTEAHKLVIERRLRARPRAPALYASGQMTPEQLKANEEDGQQRLPEV